MNTYRLKAIRSSTRSGFKIGLRKTRPYSVLGEVILLDRERTQERAGRLDILLSSLEQDRRYEVGADARGQPTNPTSFGASNTGTLSDGAIQVTSTARWLVAEDITSRFLNVIGLLSGTVPLIAIQLNALAVGDHVVLDFVRVLDQQLLRRDDTDIQLQNVDRSYWIQKTSESIIRMADELLAIINEKAEPRQQLNFNKAYIVLSDGTRSGNFIRFRPRKKHLRVVIPSGWTEDRSARFKDAGLKAEQRKDRLVFNLSPAGLKKHRELIAAVIHEVAPPPAC